MTLPHHLPAHSAVIAAHPDDESVGSAMVITRSEDVALIYVTDGAPKNPSLRSCAAGLLPVSDPALRRSERLRACRDLGVDPAHVYELGAPAQEAANHLAPLTQALVERLAALRPACVLVHPYEGGHPDHDAAAFMAHAARSLLERAGVAIDLWESTSYHGLDGGMIAGRFLSGTGKGEVTLALTPAEAARKQEILERYQSQRGALSGFPLDLERFRPAPRYDFTRPPHPPPVLYERFGWPLRAERFCELAREAALRLEVDPTHL